MTELPAHYSLAERSRTPCRVDGCDEMCVRGVTVCPFHEHMFDTGDWGPGMDGWHDFLISAAIPRKELDR